MIDMHTRHIAGIEQPGRPCSYWCIYCTRLTDMEDARRSLLLFMGKRLKRWFAFVATARVIYQTTFLETTIEIVLLDLVYR